MRCSFWLFLACSILKLEASLKLHWEGHQVPEKHTFQFSNSGQKISLLLADAPVFSLHTSVNKYQLYRIDRLLDFSTFSQMGLNLKLQLSRFSKAHLNHHDGFSSAPSFQNEIFTASNLTRSECNALCISMNAHIIRQKSELRELLLLKPDFPGHYWISHSQKVLGTVSNPEYHLNFSSHQFYPSNDFSNGQVDLFHFTQGNFEKLPLQSIKARTFYWSGERDEYYTSEPYQLLSRISGNGVDFQVIIPLLHSSHHPTFLLSECACARPLTLNLRHAYLAKSIAAKTWHQMKGKPQNIEIQRVRSVSPSASLSTVPAILRDLHRPYKPTFRDYLMDDDIYPLGLHDSLSPDVNLSLSFPSNHSISKRAISMASLGFSVLTKAIQYSTPYIVEKGKTALSKLAETIGGKLFRPSRSSGRSNASLQDQLLHNFPPAATPANITMTDDRLLIQVQDFHPALTSKASPNVRHARRLQDAALQIDFFWTHILPLLPNILAENLIPSLPYPLREDSKVLVHIQQSYSFFLVRFFFEVQRTDLSFTNIQTFSCPFKEVNKNLYAAKLSSDMIKFDFLHQDDKGTLKEKECIKSILSKQASNVFPHCTETTFVPKIVVPIFALHGGSMFLFPGPSTLKIDCFQNQANLLTLSANFHVLYISNSCSWSIQHQSMKAEVEASRSSFDSTPYLEILSINIPVFSSSESKVQIWLYVLSVVLGIVSLIIVTTYLLVSYYKHRYQPRITATDNGSVEISLKQLDFPSTDSVILEEPCLPSSVGQQQQGQTSESEHIPFPVLQPPKLSAKPAKPASRSIPV